MNTIEEFCQKYLKNVNYTINNDGTIDVDGRVDLYDRLGNMTKLPVKFGKVFGDFDCGFNKLTTLESCPNYVGGYFSCDENKITTLKGIEKCEIIGNFYSRYNNIPPENYIYILTAKIGGKIYTGNDDINNILNTYKNEVKYLHKALSELKKVLKR
jgi:hypothetical protein